MSKLILATLVATLIATSAVFAEDFPSTSGMATIDSTHILLIDDTKDKPELAARPRLRVAMLVPGGTTIETVTENWGDGTKPNDLEAIAPIPNQTGHYLVSESSYIGDKYGRLFHIQLTQNGGAWESHVVSVAQLPKGLLHGDLEGIALAAKLDGSLVLLLSERGGDSPYAPGWLWWGNFDLATGEFVRTEEQTYGQMLSWPTRTMYPGARACSDIYMDKAGYLWVSGAEDMGDNGPFRSVIYRIGRFDANQSYPVMYDGNMDLVWRLDGIKVEAIGPPVTEGSLLTFATDDENYGGIWRPLPPADPVQQQQYYGEAGG